MTTLSESLKRLVQSCGVSGYELCRRAGHAITPPELSRWTAGRAALGQAKLDALAAVLGVRVSADPLPPATRRRLMLARVNAAESMVAASEATAK